MKVVLRADADDRIGVGHAMRAFAIAQALVDVAVPVELVTAACSPGVLARFEDEGIFTRQIDRDAPSRVVAGLDRDDWVVLDGYHFDAAYAEACARSGARVLVVDDDAARRPIVATALLNPNLHASASSYGSWRCRDLLLGTRWTPMRREFRRAASHAPREPRVLLTMGGSDPPALTILLLEPLARALPDYGLDVVVGAANPRRDDVLRIAAKLPNVNVHVDVRNMTGMMRSASAAVAAAGSTAWELASTGVPMILVSLAPNQRPVAAALAASGAALDLGPSDTLGPEQVAVAVRGVLDDPARSRVLAERARGIVDGRGAQRIARYLRTGEQTDPGDWT